MNIQQRRLENGWSQEELARHSGLSTRTIQRIEGGQKAGLESLKCLAAVFETSIGRMVLLRVKHAECPAGMSISQFRNFEFKTRINLVAHFIWIDKTHVLGIHQFQRGFGINRINVCAVHGKI